MAASFRIGDTVEPGSSETRCDPPAVFLMGTTASGKTDLAAALSQRFPLELVSVDTAQVYRGMDIGTAKPSRNFLEQYPHHLIDIRDPSDTYSAAQFVADARRLIDDIRQRHRIPLLVGGAMFYFHALEHGLSPLPAADPSVRDVLRREMAEQGVETLHGKLDSLDPITAARIDVHDAQRVQRALEIHRLTGMPPSDSMQVVRGLCGNPVKLSLFCADREKLHRRIRARFGDMLEQGLVEEVSAIGNSLEDPSSVPSMRTVGYRQVLEMLEGKTGIVEMTEKAVAATRQLAKRQLTWLRQQRGLVWIQASAGGRVLDAVAEYLEHCPGYGDARQPCWFEDQKISR